MAIPLEIHFHGVERSEAVEARIADKLRSLEKHFTRMTHCKVFVDLPHKQKDKSKIFQIKLEIGVPGHQSIVVSNDSENDHDHEDIQLAIRDAFDKARRRIDAMSDMLKAPAKKERDRRRPAPNSSAEE